MPTNLALDDRLIEKVRRLGGYRSKREAVNGALREYVVRRAQLRVLDLFGKVPYDPAYDSRAERRRRRP